MLLEVALDRDRAAATRGDRSDGRFRMHRSSLGQSAAPLPELLGE